MLRRWGVVLVGLGIAFATTGSLSSCKKAAALGDACSINSNCDSPLVCAFGHCHDQCAASRDCPSGETCVLSGASGVCQLPSESPCTSNVSCESMQVCAMGPGIVGEACRSECTTTAACLANQECVPQSGGNGACLDTSSTADGGMVGSQDGSANGDGGTSSDGSSTRDGAAPTDATLGPDSAHDATIGDTGASNGDTGTDGNSCVNSSTQFGNIAQGDSNPNFTSGVGSRSATDLYIFDGYNGPNPAGDGGGNPVALVYVQAFDPKTAASKGPAVPLFAAPTLGANTTASKGVILFSTAVAPTGAMALVYDVNYEGGAQNVFYAAFLAPSASGPGDAGVYGLALQSVVVLETSLSTGIAGNGQPYVIWSDTIQAFVISWQYQTGQTYLHVANYLAGGQPAGGGAQTVPTTQNGVVQHGRGYENSGSVGESKKLFGVAYIDSESSSNPAITLLDPLGDQVGATTDVISSSSQANSAWVAVAGTANGLVYFYDNSQPDSVSEVFLPISSDAGVIGGFTDGGGDSGFPMFSFTGAMRATSARAIADGPGGSGGVGLALLYPNGVSFAYVQANGIAHEGPNTLIAHTAGGSDEISMTNVAGSFVVSLYNSSANSTQVLASGCQ